MSPKNNDLTKGIGAALQSVSKLLGGTTAKERHLQNNLPKVAPALPSDVDKCQSGEFEAQKSMAVAPHIEEHSVVNDLSSSFQIVTEEQTSPATVEEATPSGIDMVVSGSIQLNENVPSSCDTSGQDNLAPELPTSNYEVSNDCRSLLIQQCKQVAENCANVLQKREPSSYEPIRNGDKAQAFLFDVVNCRVSDFSGSGTSTQMPIFCCMDDKEPNLCNPHGIYSQMLVDCYELFHDERKETRYLRSSILRRSLEEVIGSSLPASGCRFMCLIPDIVDDFDQVFREQLNYCGTPLFQVPRSIALAYTVQAEGWFLPDEFLCLDYDGEDFFAIKLYNVMDENNDHIFVRMGREKLPGKHPSTRELSIEYLRQYQEKHGLHLSENTLSNLVNTKLLQHLLFEQSRFLLVDNNGVVTPLYVDTEILEGIAERIYDDMEQIQDDTGMTVYAMCALFKDPSGSLYNISQMEVGCQAICERADQGKTLWQEYLPDLRLEVNRNGCFDQIQLIGDEDRRQNINNYALNERVQIPVCNGTIIFPANGEKYYDLPLVREVYGRHAREKLARFKLEKPLKQPVQVELSVQYRYGDIDSYQLIAYSKDLDQTILSSWIDTDTIRLSNPVPVFSEADIKKRDISPKDIEEVYDAFLQMSQKVRSQVRPPKLRYNSVYSPPNNPKEYYSEYLRELNGRNGWPFFPIQNFFKKEYSNETMQYIHELVDRQVFADVGDVLCGILPSGYELGIDENSKLHEGRELIRNMANIACNFGIFYTLLDDSTDDSMVYETIENILSYYRKPKNLRIQYWAPITKYVQRSNDSHDVWTYFCQSLTHLDSRNPQKTIIGLRAISSVCFQTENWIFDLYHSSTGKDDVERIIDSIIAVLNDEKSLTKKDLQGKYNPRGIRDVLELLLCICRLKEEDPTILDCNAPRTKELVKQLKRIDSDMRVMKEEGLLKHTFNSHLGISAPEEYSRVNPVIYALVETLSGGEHVSLIGFSDEEYDD